MFCRFRVVALISLLLAGVDLCIAGTLYVSLTGDDKNNGKTEETAWRTFTHATEQAKAGDTVYIKAGDYGPERITVRNSGTKDKPIVFQGYQKEPGDNPFPNYKPGDAPDPALMPLLNGKDGTGIAIKLRNKKHVQFKNLALTRYDWGIYPLNCEHIVLDHVFATNCYKEENPSYGVGFYFIASHHSAVRDCIVADASGNNIVALRSNFMVIENCKTYATVEDGIKRPDYGIVIGDSHDCVIRNCLAHNLYPENG
ncbi:MAG: right-handed parallel beta-helix repeat-containing protein, partial [Planctomycetota bacterium]|nr:right-handed parallel beta-helix repeat-containing protein [Planctomycetota bacterium]